MSDRDTPISYTRPVYLAPLLAVAAAGALIAAVIGYVTYGRVDSASREDVLANRTITQRLADAERVRDAENESHRLRNEEAHACIAQLLEELLHRHGDRGNHVDFITPDPCRVWSHAGEVPHITIPTTTTATTRRTATTQRRRTTTTTVRRSTTSPNRPTTGPTKPVTTTTTCALTVAGQCLS